MKIKFTVPLYRNLFLSIDQFKLLNYEILLEFWNLKLTLLLFKIIFLLIESFF